ncbi:MAG: hypothetical protein FJ265_03730 [Planctomycetes bacterium]|nr:hypothetical protein [Planctomycetota bacterium]
MKRALLGLGAAGCFGGALLLARPATGDLREVASWCLRPAALPFAWRALHDAVREGNADEAFARGQQIMALVPSWLDGHCAFAFRFALAGGNLAAPAPERVAAAHRRLLVAIAWLEAARAHAGRREIELLEILSFLPETAVGNEPGLAGLLPAGGAPALADAWLAEAERLGAGPAVREQRTFRAVAHVAALLLAGDRRGALAVLATAIRRSADVRDVALATVWRTRLEQVRAHLLGEAADLSAVAADARMAPLLPFLR